MPARRLQVLAILPLFGALSACAVDGSDSPDEVDDPECTGDKCDDLGPGEGAALIFNPCPIGLRVGIIPDGSAPGTSPSSSKVIPPGGALRFAAEKNDAIATTDVAGLGWRTVDWVEASDEIWLDSGWCQWDVYIESGVVSEKAADGRDWDPYLAGAYTRPDPYAIAYADGQKDNCQGHPWLEGSPTSTASDTTAPEWNRESLSGIAWHDMSTGIELFVTDDDVGPGGEPIGSCVITDIPPPEALPAVITSDCGGGGSMTIRIEPADAAIVKTSKLVIFGSCS